MTGWSIGSDWSVAAAEPAPLFDENETYAYDGPHPSGDESYANVDEWAAVYRARLLRSVAMTRLLVGAGTVGGPSASLKAATALAAENATTFYKYTGLWKPSKLGLAYLMFFAVFDSVTESYSRVEAAELDMPFAELSDFNDNAGSASEVVQAFDGWLATQRAHWPNNMSFTDASGRRRAFRIDRCYLTVKNVMAQHAANASTLADEYGLRPAQRITKAVIELQYIFAQKSDVFSAVHVATTQGLVLDTFAHGYWEVKGARHFCETSMPPCTAAGILPYDGIDACVAALEETPLFSCERRLVGLGKSKTCRLLHSVSAAFGAWSVEKHCLHWGAEGGPDADGVYHCLDSECGEDWSAKARAVSPAIELPSLNPMATRWDGADLACRREGYERSLRGDGTDAACAALFAQHDAECAVADEISGWQQACELELVVLQLVEGGAPATCIAALLIFFSAPGSLRCPLLATHPFTLEARSFDLRHLLTQRTLALQKYKVYGREYVRADEVGVGYGPSAYSSPRYALHLQDVIELDGTQQVKHGTP